MAGDWSSSSTGSSSSNESAVPFKHAEGPSDWVSDSITFYFIATICVLAVLHGLVLALCVAKTAGSQKLRTMCCVTLSDHLVGVVYYPVLTLLAWASTLEIYNKHSVGARWGMTIPLSSMYTILFVAENLVHIPVVICRRQSRSLKLQILAHHFVTCWWYTYGLRTSKMEFFGTLAGCAEVTNVFLGHVMLLKEFGAPGSPWLAINGVFLWIGFVVFRLCLFPFCLYLWYSDVSQFPEQTLQVNETFYALIYFPGILMLSVLSALWFVSITKGMISTIRKSAAKSA